MKIKSEAYNHLGVLKYCDAIVSSSQLYTAVSSLNNISLLPVLSWIPLALFSKIEKNRYSELKGVTFYFDSGVNTEPSAITIENTALAKIFDDFFNKCLEKETDFNWGIPVHEEEREYDDYD